MAKKFKPYKPYAPVKKDIPFEKPYNPNKGLNPNLNFLNEGPHIFDSSDIKS